MTCSAAIRSGLSVSNPRRRILSMVGLVADPVSMRVRQYSINEIQSLRLKSTTCTQHVTEVRGRGSTQRDSAKLQVLRAHHVAITFIRSRYN